MRARILSLAFCLIAGSAAAQGPQASFDCAKAATPIEKAICQGHYTGELDIAMAELYRAALARAAEPAQKSALEASQRQWLAKRNTSCGRTKPDSECIARLYKERIMALVRMTRPEGGKGQSISGQYTYREKGEAGEMFLAEMPDGTTLVFVETVNVGHISPHSCSFMERLKGQGGVLEFRDAKTSATCGLQIRVSGNRAQMSETPKDCYDLVRSFCGAHGFMLGNYHKR